MLETCFLPFWPKLFHSIKQDPKHCSMESLPNDCVFMSILNVYTLILQPFLKGPHDVAGTKPFDFNFMFTAQKLQKFAHVTKRY